tara:strand:+ start:560 stop:832 length:273 start_codon:yes stop_codon:yes gene_type:complete
MSDAENTVELAVTIALFRCFHEQLHNLKGSHSKLVKYKFNKLCKVARQYEDEIIKVNKQSDEDLDLLYDGLMDVIVDIKKELLKSYEEQR